MVKRHIVLMIIMGVLIAFFLSNPQKSVVAKGDFDWPTIVLYQPDEYLKPRVTDVTEFANYTAKIGEQAAAAFDKQDNLRPTTGAVVVVLKPNNRARFWVMSSDYTIPKSVIDDFRKRFNGVRPATVKRGPVAFAVNFTVKGGGKKLIASIGPAPIPDEWDKAIKRAGKFSLIPDGIMKIIWPGD